MRFSNLRKQLFRFSGAGLAVAALALIAPVAMHATPITYNLTITETDGNGSTYSGTGQVTLNVTGGIKDYTAYTTSTGITALQLTVDGQTFNITDPTNQGNVAFGFTDVSTGGVWDLTFSETNANGYRLVSNGSQYIFYKPVNKPVSGTGWTGDFSASLAPPPHPSLLPTPEPGGIALLGTGLLACAGGLRRRIHRS